MDSRYVNLCVLGLMKTCRKMSDRAARPFHLKGSRRSKAIPEPSARFSREKERERERRVDRVGRGEFDVCVVHTSQYIFGLRLSRGR